MSKKVAVIHTSFVSVNDLKDLFKEIIPSVKMINIVDDSLLAEVLENSGLTNNVIRRICAYAFEAQAMGADAIFNQCSSVGEAVDVARKMLNIPFIKVDESMAEEAVKIGGNISVVATVPTTLGPSVRLIENTAIEMNKRVTIRRCLVEGAFDALVKERDKEKHNRMVRFLS
jgi:Asp/Glu/hydantoin racemase